MSVRLAIMRSQQTLSLQSATPKTTPQNNGKPANLNKSKAARMSGTKRRHNDSTASTDEVETDAKRIKETDASAVEAGTNNPVSTSDQDASAQEVRGSAVPEAAREDEVQGVSEGESHPSTVGSADESKDTVQSPQRSANELIAMSTIAVNADSDSDLSDMDVDDVEKLGKEVPFLSATVAIMASPTQKSSTDDSSPSSHTQTTDGVIMDLVASTLAGSPQVQQNTPQLGQTRSGTRRSGRAIKVPTRLHGITSEEDLGRLDVADSASEREGDIEAKTKKLTPRTTTARVTKPKLETTKTSTPKTASRQKTAPQKQASSATSKTSVSTRLVKISTANHPSVSDYLSNASGSTSKARAVKSKLPPSPTSTQESFTPELDAELVRISKALTFREPLDTKPLPQGQPLVWADSRQALIETVPYFKKPQGGCHSKDGHVYTFMFDGVGHCREYMDSDVIIARAGGSMESDGAGMAQSVDQSMTDSQVLAMLNDIQLQNPLIVICGEKNAGSPTKMPRKYCVLGWYKPISVWAERTAGKGKRSYMTVKYRLERLNAAEKPWHAPINASEIDAPKADVVGPLDFQTCGHCAQKWPQAYLLSWICLNPACDLFWKIASGEDAPCGILDYNPAFLMARTTWDVEAEPYSVKPPLPKIRQAIGANLTYINTRGICCPDCGRCNHRYKFSGWICDNPDCHWAGLKADHLPIEAVSLHQPWDNVGGGPSLGRNRHDAAVHLAVSYSHGYKVMKYTVDGVKGSVTHCAANARIVEEHQGPDEMFTAVQTEDMGLERRRFKVEKMASKKLSQKTAIYKPSKAVKGTSKLRQRPSNAHAQPLTPESEEAPEVDSSAVAGISEVTESDLNTQASATLEETASSIEAALVPNIDDGQTHVAVQEEVDLADEAVEADDPATQDIDVGDFMTAFSMNYGMPYKFVASGASKSFEESAWPVRACRSRLNWAQRTFLEDRTDDVDFNEELIFAYMEGQKIDYHDDGEEGLGPRIATMSLGGRAKMHLRMKMKYSVGCSKSGLMVVDDKPPIPGGLGGAEMDEKRLAAWEELQGLKTTDKVQYNKRIKELPRELMLDAKYTRKSKDRSLYGFRNQKASDLITLTLGHGDIVLMDGYDIQKYLEHKVVPENDLRYAMTCRTVLETHLKPEERPPYEVKADDWGYDGSGLL